MPGPRLAEVAMRAVYAAAGAAAAVATTLRAAAAGGNDAERLRQRQGLWNGHRELAQPWIWIHAASVGEAEIAIALARALAPRLSSVRLVISSMTATGKARVAREAGIESRYFPIDFAPFLKRVLEPVPPLLFVAVETEIWPETLRLLAARGVPAAVVNARISDASYPRYRRLAPLVAPLVGGLARVCARDAGAASRWRDLGAAGSAVEVTGNIKFDLASPRDVASISPLFEKDTRPLVVAASTHEGEEDFALDAFAGLRARSPAARLVLAPRHPPRAAAVAALVRARHLAVEVLETPGALERLAWPAETDVVVLGRLGLLRQAYAASDAAFVGGSAVEGPGGHNLLEPAVAGCPLAAGRHLGNVGDQADYLAEAAALRIVANVNELSSFWAEVIEKPDYFCSRLKAAQAGIRELGGALERTVALLLPLIPAARIRS